MKINGKVQLTNTKGDPMGEPVPAHLRDGLALHGERGSWKVTHVRSGGGVLRCFERRKDAEAALPRLLVLGDWTRSKDTCVNDPEIRTGVKAIYEERSASR